MGKRVVSGMDEQIATWVSAKIPGHPDFTGSPFTAIGLLDGAGYLQAGVVYTTYTGNDIVLHIGLLNRKSITRRFIEEGFRYPFLQLQCSRVTVLVARDNVSSHEFVKRLGWTQEGVLREWYQDGQDAILYGMLRRQCRWIHPRRRYGQPVTDQPRSAAPRDRNATRTRRVRRHAPTPGECPADAAGTAPRGRSAANGASGQHPRGDSAPR